MILRATVLVDESPERGLGTEIAELFRGIGLDFEIPEFKGALVRPVTFDE
jgi:hypothetical protein